MESQSDAHGSSSRFLTRLSLCSGAQARKRLPRECACGKRLRGTARKIAGAEVCGGCRSRLMQGLPQPLKVQRKRAASPHAAAQLPAAATAASTAQPSLKRRRIESTIADSTRAGLQLLGDADIIKALRCAMEIRGSYAPLASGVPAWLARRYIHARTTVDDDSAAAVLSDALRQRTVTLLRDFPGAHTPAYSSVDALLANRPPEQPRKYAFRKDHQAAHYFLCTPFNATPADKRANEWWERHRDKFRKGDKLWTVVSRRARSGLHTDPGDGLSTQTLGTKLWVFVKLTEAMQHGIAPVEEDPMRSPPPHRYDFDAWRKCESLRWCVLSVGDTVVIPQDHLHAVGCIRQDSVSAAIYC